SAWWCVFNDPVLNGLVQDAYRQNLTVREAGFRIMAARAEAAVGAGNQLPPGEPAFPDYDPHVISRQVKNTAQFPERFLRRWDGGFNLAWELDFWGRFRRAVESFDAALDASVENYDDVLVTLVADVATAYVNYRIAQRRLELARTNTRILEEIAAKTK